MQCSASPEIQEEACTLHLHSTLAPVLHIDLQYCPMTPSTTHWHQHYTASLCPVSPSPMLNDIISWENKLTRSATPKRSQTPDSERHCHVCCCSSEHGAIPPWVKKVKNAAFRACSGGEWVWVLATKLQLRDSMRAASFLGSEGTKHNYQSDITRDRSKMSNSGPASGLCWTCIGASSVAWGLLEALLQWHV